jgi:ssDNA-binding Zn-finger/Zn-ribbon topoisomerase 1
MKFINHLKIKAWQAKVLGKDLEYTAKIPCPICGSKLIMKDSEKEKYMNAVGDQAVRLSKAHDPKSLSIHLIKHPPIAKIYWMCENYDCEFNGEDDGKPEKAESDGSEK